MFHQHKDVQRRHEFAFALAFALAVALVVALEPFLFAFAFAFANVLANVLAKLPFEATACEAAHQSHGLQQWQREIICD